MKIAGATAIPRGAGQCVVEIGCEGGVCRGQALADAAVAPLVSGLAAEVLVGNDARSVAALFQSLSDANARAHGALGAAVAALDCALWQLKAQIEGVPLWRSLGALLPRTRTHGRIDLSVADDSLESAVTALAARGLRDVVFTSTLDAGRDSARLSAARAALGSESALMLDLGERLPAKEAINLICRIERNIDLTWIEAPAARADFPGLRRVSDAIRGAVCAGGHHSTPGDYLPALHARAIDIVQIDLALVGISGALQVSDAAFGLELPVVIARGPDDLGVQVGAALPYCSGVEVAA